MVDINSLSAVTAYRNQLKMLKEADIPVPTEEKDKSAFSEMVKDALKGSVETAYASDATSMAAVQGKVDLSDLVTAVANADLTLNTVIAVRDKVIGAYEDIIKMPI